jgi:trk system potassium uptake protein TrkA
MEIIVAGGGNVGRQVARTLMASSHHVTVVESDRTRAASLKAEGFEVVTGNASVATSLEAAGALRADVLVACTERDEENLVIAVLAKRHLRIPRVVARINDDANQWLFDDSWGVDAALSSASALAALVASTAISPSTGSASLED